MSTPTQQHDKPASGPTDTQPAPVTTDEALQKLETLMAQHALTMGESLIENWEQAPFNQRMGAFGQLFDRLLRLRDILHEDNTRRAERVAIVYEDADGTQHNTPFWQRAGKEDAT